MTLSNNDLDNIIFKIKDIFLSKKLSNSLFIKSSSKKVDEDLRSDIEENIIVYLLELFPGSQVISQSFGLVNQSANSDYYTLIIKGLSGFSNLKNDIPIYGFSIAIITGNEINLSNVLYSLICDVSLNINVTAIKKQGVWINNLKYKEYFYQNDIILCSLDNCDSDVISLFYKLFNKKSNIRFFGSSVINFIYLIKGSCQAYYNFNNLENAYDFIAPYLVIKEIGGAITCFKGYDLNNIINIKKSYNFIASRKKESHSYFINLIK